MPTYAYRCADCGHAFDVHQSFSDDALTTCPECGGSLRKVFSTVGVVFKGSGFYRTDSRSGKGAGKSSTVPAGSSSGTSGSSAGSSAGSSGASSATAGASSSPSGSSTSGSAASKAASA